MRKIIILLIFLFATQTFAQWQQISTIPTTQLNAVKFFDAYTGIAAGMGGIWRSTNSGMNWTQTLVYGNINSVSFPSVSLGHAVGDSGSAFVTTDNGLTWLQQYTGIFENLNGVSFFNTSYGNAVGQRGRILRTTSGGQNWFTVTNSTIEDLNFVQMFDDIHTAFTVGSLNNEVFEISNTGYNWMPQFVNFGNALNGGCYIPPGPGGIIAVGVSGRIRRTPDYSLHWSIITCPVNQTLNSIVFVDGLTGFIAGNAGTILITSDGGLNWAIQSSPTGANLKCISMINSTTGWIVGTNGIVLREGIPLEIIGLNMNTPKNFKLEQNYPNPFNPSTNIKFEIVAGSLVSLKVYDILGKEVAALVNNQLSPGKYSVGWNAAQYSSGVYFYKLETGEFTSVKKMVLIK